MSIERAHSFSNSTRKLSLYISFMRYLMGLSCQDNSSNNRETNRIKRGDGGLGDPQQRTHLRDVESEKSFEKILQTLPKHFGENWLPDDEFDGAGGNDIETDDGGTRDIETVLSVFYNYDGQHRNRGEGKADEKNTKGPRNP